MSLLAGRQWPSLQVVGVFESPPAITIIHTKGLWEEEGWGPSLLDGGRAYHADEGGKERGTSMGRSPENKRFQRVVRMLWSETHWHFEFMSERIISRAV